MDTVIGVIEYASLRTKTARAVTEMSAANKGRRGAAARDVPAPTVCKCP